MPATIATAPRAALRAPRTATDPRTATTPRLDLPATDQLLDLRDLELRSLQGRVFGPLTWTLPASADGAILGEQGSGRSSLLLALTGRMRGITGALSVAGVDAVAHPRQARHLTSVARIEGLVELEPRLKVGEARDERSLLEGVPTRRGRPAFRALEDAVDYHFDPELAVEELPAVQRTLLALLLGCLRPALFVVVDNVDDSLTETQLEWIYAKLATLHDLGHRFVVSALETSPLPAGAATLTLAPPDTPDSLPLSFGRLGARRALPKELS